MKVKHEKGIKYVQKARQVTSTITNEKHTVSRHTYGASVQHRITQAM